MRIVIQRVKKAQVVVEERIVGSIAKGALVLLGVHKEDDPSKIPWLSQKLLHLRMFSDEHGKMNLSLMDIRGEILIVSQFTLYAQCSEGRRPDFFSAAAPSLAETLYQQFITAVKSSDLKVETGIFGADMEVSLINDGPVTFIIDGK